MTIGSIDEYIHISKMDESSTWATQVEMFALTHLLGICLYVYSEHFGRWNKYDPCILDSMITIYVNHPTNHFEVVTSISLVLEDRTIKHSLKESQQPALVVTTALIIGLPPLPTLYIGTQSPPNLHTPKKTNQEKNS